MSLFKLNLIMLIEQRNLASKKRMPNSASGAVFSIIFLVFSQQTMASRKFASKNHDDDPFWDNFDEKKPASGSGSDDETVFSLPKSDDPCDWGRAKLPKAPLIQSPPTKPGWFCQSAKWIYGKKIDKPIYCESQEREQLIAQEVERADQLCTFGRAFNAVEVLYAIQQGKHGKFLSEQGNKQIDQKLQTHFNMSDLADEIANQVAVIGAFDDDSKATDAKLSVNSKVSNFEGSFVEDEALNSSSSSDGSTSTVVNQKNIFSSNNSNNDDTEQSDEEIVETVPTKQRY